MLGAILIDNAQIDTAAELVTSRDFFRDAHRIIYEVMLELAEENRAVDLVELKDRLAQTGELDEVGGPAYIASLTDGVPRASNVDHYCKIIKEKKAMRGLVLFAQRIIEQVVEGDEGPARILEQADTMLLDLQHGHSNGRMIELSESLDDKDRNIFKRIEDRGNHRGIVTGVPSGFALLDEMTMGFQPGHLWIVAASPSIGKTTWVMNAAVNAARLAQKRGAIFSLEMSLEELEDRMLSSLSDVDHHRILSGHLAERDYPRISQALGVMHDLPLHIDDTPARTAPSIRRICRRIKSEKGLDFVVIDYLQLMPGVLDGRETDDKQIGDTCARLKTMAKELRVPVILLSQINRDPAKRNDPRPQLSDLRGSGMIEAHADAVLFLWRKDHRVGGPTEGILRKQRNGPTGTIGLSLTRETLLFTEAELPVVDQPKKGKKGKAEPEAEQGALIDPPEHNPE